VILVLSKLMLCLVVVEWSVTADHGFCRLVSLMCCEILVEM
jgi:hypothetical protein